MQAVIELARTARERRTKPLKTPLAEIVVYQPDKQYVDDLKSLETYITTEMNLKQITYKMEKASQIIKLRAVPDQKRLGARLRKEMGPVLAAVKMLGTTDIENFEKTGTMTVAGHVLDTEDVKVVREFAGDTTQYESAYDDTVLIVLNVKEDPLLEREGTMRSVVNKVQRLRKAAGLSPIDKDVIVYYSVSSDDQNGKTVLAVIAEFLDKIQVETNSTLMPMPSEEVKGVIESSSSKVNEAKFELKLVRKTQ